MIDLTAALARVLDALDSVGGEHVIVGSGAGAAWGVTRSTRDIDLIALVDADAGGRLLGAIDHDDVYVPVDDARRAVREGGMFNVLHPTTGGKVDVFIADPNDEFDLSRLARRVRSDVLGVPAWISSAEDVVLAKLRWRVESRSEVQWRDCVEIAATQHLDTEYLAHWAHRLGVAQDLDELLAS